MYDVLCSFSYSIFKDIISALVGRFFVLFPHLVTLAYKLFLLASHVLGMAHKGQFMFNIWKIGKPG